MERTRLEELENNRTTSSILHFIPNVLGINLCSVEDVIVERTPFDEISRIEIKFIPAK